MTDLERSVDGGGRRAWVIALLDGTESAVLAAAVRASGAEARLVSGAEILDEACHPAHGLVVEMTRTRREGLAAVLHDVRDRQPGLPIVAVLESGDVAGAWAAMRCGATPWLRPSLHRSLVRCSATTADLVDQLGARATRRVPHDAAAAGHAVGSALVHALSGRPQDAITELCRIAEGEGTAVAIDALTEMSAEILQRLDQRSRYPIPLRYVVERLQVDPDDIDVCVGFLYDATFRNAGVVVDRDDLFPGRAAPDQLFGAFHATAALVRFAAARWWAAPCDVLDRLHDESDVECLVAGAPG